ncbi:MAG: hypothetical protein OXC80_04200 [Gammaproteobacteria bacterium]|nr:hypothetical protein [Gammaproteobacteria bacterium]
MDELLDYAPSDGLDMGFGHVNGHEYPEEKSRCVLTSYDYSVLAGSQGGMNHKMMDRMIQTAAKINSSTVLFTEGSGDRAGGGSRNARPGRGGSPVISGGGGLNTPSWALLSKLSGRVPLKVLGIATTMIPTSDSLQKARGAHANAIPSLKLHKNTALSELKTQSQQVFSDS